MNTYDPCNPFIAAVKAEHREMHLALANLQRRLDAIQPGDVAQRLPEVRRQFDELRQRLAAHFQEEEAGGCLDVAVARLPRLGEAVTRIEDEHPRILAALDALLERVAGNTPAEQWPDVLLAYRELATMLAQHEALENRVLEQGFNEDLTTAV
jgi:iron-sulfur cluster repair protein YtfE (RIC family)